MIFMNRNCGFIALVSTIIIASVSLLIILTINFSVFNLRFNILENEYKDISFVLAWGCFDKIVLEVMKNNVYNQGDKIFINGNFCIVDKFDHLSNLLDLSIKTEIKGATTNLDIKFDTKNQNIVFWREF